MAASRDAILGALGGGTVPAVAPVWEGEALRFDDPLAAFTAALEAAGASLRRFPAMADLERALPGLDPETAVLRGGPAVAESGAVWWVPRDEAERRQAFLAERVVLVVERARLVDDLHGAYRRIDPSASHYGCFVSGPSKTADIEQALVIGAHGPRELAVWLWGPPAG